MLTQRNSSPPHQTMALVPTDAGVSEIIRRLVHHIDSSIDSLSLLKPYLYHVPRARLIPLS